MKNKLMWSRVLSVIICTIMVTGVLTVGGEIVSADEYVASNSIAAIQQETEVNPFAELDKEYSEALETSVLSNDAAVQNAATYQEQEMITLEDSTLNRYNMEFKPECSYEMIYNLVKEYEFNIIGDSSNRVFSIDSIEDFDTIQTIFDEYCEFVEEDIEMYMEEDDLEFFTSELDTDVSGLSMPNDPYISLQWHLDCLNIEAAWDYSTGSADVLVAVIDSGIDRSHPDLVDADIRNGYDYLGDSQPVLTDYRGHGTAVTGVIAATMNNGIGITGISPDVAIIPLCVLNAEGWGSSSDIAEAIYAAADLGCQVINLSLGGDYTSIQEGAISYAYSKGCIIIAAAGNEGAGTPRYPASFNGVICVGSVNESSARSSFSNYNNRVDVMAPGEKICTTRVGGDYAYFSGTSFSAPCVAAIAALTASVYPEITPLEFEELIKTTSTDLGAAGYDNDTGYGLVNAYGILQTYTGEKVSYQTHVQDVGWQAYVSNGAISGTSGQSKRLEAIHIKLENISGGIEYRTHVQDIGWQDWVANDALSGTSGQSKRLEAIQIRLTGEAATLYDVYYCVHAENTGWMDWAKNGESSGTAGYSYRLEAIKIILVDKGAAAPGSTARPFIEKPIVDTVSYKTHVQDIGWQAYVSNGEVSGTSGQSKRLEAIQIKLENMAGGIEYRTHVQDYGWMAWVANDTLSGTSAQSKRLEAIQIRLTGEAAVTYDVYYRVHAQNTGWLDWAKNGDSSGTAGFGYRLEAIQIVLVLKGSPAPGATARPFVQG